ncbi:MAG: branched-chain amino acid ABC transporter permease [Nitrospinae bacterium]|nr:branched-chain amino acid ABC transporter permease [Nitrospinota bacterium]
MDWNFLFVNSLNGIIYGSFLALTSLGLSLVFGLGRVVNFAHGVLYALGGYFFIIFLPSLGWSAMLFAPLVVVPLAIAMEWLTIAPIRNRDEIYTLLVTFGLSFMITGAIEYLWGTETTLIKPPVIFQGTVDILGNQFPVYRLFASTLSLLVTGLVFVFIQFTPVGLKIRAITDDNEMAEALGINTRWLLTSIFGGAAGFAAFAGALGAPIFSVEPEMGMGIIIDSFLAVILGGLGHLPGTAVGAFIVALAKSIGGGYIAEWAIAVLFLVVAAIMVLRPKGVFGRGRIA